MGKIKLPQKIKLNYKRVVAGILLLILELYLFLGTGVMCEDVSNFHSGEGSWQEVATDNATEFRQVFQPQYDNLQLISFLMFKEDMTVLDGLVTITIEDENNQVLFTEQRGLDKIANGRFTDVEVNLQLSPRENYYLLIECAASSSGEYPAVGVCNKDKSLPENDVLIHQSERADVQLVSRYQYTDALTGSQIGKAVLICVLTALGIMFGVPDNKYVRRTLGCILLLVTPCVLGYHLEHLNFSEVHYLPFAMKWNVALILLLELLVLLCTHSPRVAVVLTNSVVTLLYSVNYFMIMYRGTALRVNDFNAIGTAAGVMGEYDLTPNSQLAAIWGMLVLFVIYALQTKPSSRMDKEEKKSRRVYVLASYAGTILLAVVIAVYGGHKLLYTDYLNDKGFADKEFFGINYELIYSHNGFLIGSCVEIKNSRITQPEGYSITQAEEILQSVQEETEGGRELPHVILIMNESLADIRTVADVELTQENMSFLNSLKENTVRGYTSASVLGGGTANSEFEVFTGCSTAFLPVNYYPYQQAIRKPIDSMVSQMKEYGYTAVAMHPANESNWNRRNVYRYMGFDQMFFRQDFEGEEVIHSGVSDAATYRRIIELYENRQADEKLFVFDVTMQNHGGYTPDESPAEVQALQLNEPQIDKYLSLVKVSDEAFADLVGYFEKQDEKVIICMFGDHQPWIFNLIKDEELLVGDSYEERLMNLYRTPFVIWANYDIEEADDYDISMNYLGGLLMDTAGIPKSAYFAYLEGLREEYPIITVNGYVDSEGNYSEWSGTKNEFLDYRMLQYNYLFDKNTVEWGY